MAKYPEPASLASQVARLTRQVADLEHQMKSRSHGRDVQDFPYHAFKAVGVADDAGDFLVEFIFDDLTPLPNGWKSANVTGYAGFAFGATFNDTANSGMWPIDPGVYSLTIGGTSITGPGAVTLLALSALFNLNSARYIGASNIAVPTPTNIIGPGGPLIGVFSTTGPTTVYIDGTLHRTARSDEFHHESGI